jgi:hypothetical protein
MNWVEVNIKVQFHIYPSALGTFFRAETSHTSFHLPHLNRLLCADREACRGNLQT